jgi:hypothetical protein
MSPVLVALLAAAVSAAAPTPPDALAAAGIGPSVELLELATALGADDPRMASMPGEDLVHVVPGALPPPPTVVVRETRYYGTITIDHAAHLARRARCFQCHGPGPVRKIEFTPKIAHERCIGCHQQVAKGPDKCQGCHVKPAPPPEQVAAAAAAAAPPEPPPTPQPNAENVAAALAAFDKPLPLERRPDPFARRLEVGVAAGAGIGLSVRFVSTQDWLVLSESLEGQRNTTESRTLLLFGGGVCRPFNRDIMIETAAVAGFDVFDRPVTALFPMVGLRTSAQFRQPAPFLQHLTASLTWGVDLTRRAFGQEVGGYAIYGSIATGFRMP